MNFFLHFLHVLEPLIGSVLVKYFEMLLGLWQRQKNLLLRNCIDYMSQGAKVTEVTLYLTGIS